MVCYLESECQLLQNVQIMNIFLFYSQNGITEKLFFFKQRELDHIHQVQDDHWQNHSFPSALEKHGDTTKF